MFLLGKITYIKLVAEGWPGHWHMFWILMCSFGVLMWILHRKPKTKYLYGKILVECLRCYQRDSGHGVRLYQKDCRFYPIDFQMRDQCMSICETYFDRRDLIYLDDDAVMGVFLKSKLVLATWGKMPDNLQKEQNEQRIADWIAKKMRRTGHDD